MSVLILREVNEAMSILTAELWPCNLIQIYSEGHGCYHCCLTESLKWYWVASPKEYQPLNQNYKSAIKNCLNTENKINLNFLSSMSVSVEWIREVICFLIQSIICFKPSVFFLSHLKVHAKE